MDEAGTSFFSDCATDTLVEILRRLSAASRRRCRLVCRYWRATIDERTKGLRQSDAKTLLAGDGSAHVLGDGWSLKKVMMSSRRNGRKMNVVGTCNDLLCLCDDSKPGGAIFLANPATGEKLALPLLTRDDISSADCWHCAYSFAHHERTGRYKAVHVPCCFWAWEFPKLQVFTLGEASWRDVATPAINVSCRLRAGVVSVDGATYWFAQVSGRIVSLDLEDEHVTSINGPPMPAGFSSFELVEVHGRLGVTVFDDGSRPNMSKTKVLVLESVSGAHRWTCWYYVELDMYLRRDSLLKAHFMHGEYLLARGFHAVYASKPSGKWRSRRGDVLLIRIDQGKYVYIGDIYRATSRKRYFGLDPH